MNMPKIFEQMKKDAEKDGDLAKMIGEGLARAEHNPWMRKAAEALMSDQASALASVHDVIVEAAMPALIGREMISVVPTTSKGLRFFIASKGAAYVTAELSETWDSPETQAVKDIDANIIIRSGASWSRSFIEDFEWPILARQAAERGRSIGELETTRIVNLYKTVAANVTAKNASTPWAMCWDDIVNMWKYVKNQNRNPTILAIPPNKMADLWKDDKFIHAFYFGSQADVRRGVLGDVYLGMKVISSTLLGTVDAFVIDLEAAAAMLLRRDVTAEPFEDPAADRYGIVASERIGLDLLDPEGAAASGNKGVARITYGG